MNHQDLSKTAFFQGIEKKLFSKLTDGGSFEAFTKNELAFEEGKRGDRFGIVMSGLFRMTKDDPCGARVGILYLGAGDLTGDIAMAEAEPRYIMSCETLVSGLIFWIPRETYLQHWLTSPLIMKRVQTATLERLKWMADCRADQRLSLERRLAGFLLRSHARAKDFSDSASLTFTRLGLADAVGASVESVIRIMTRWEKRGFVHTASKVIQIAQSAKLKEIYKESQKRPQKS